MDISESNLMFALLFQGQKGSMQVQPAWAPGWNSPGIKPGYLSTSAYALVPDLYPACPHTSDQMIKWSLRRAASQLHPDTDSSVVGLQTRGNGSWDRCEKLTLKNHFWKPAYIRIGWLPSICMVKNSISVDSMTQLSCKASKQGREIV